MEHNAFELGDSALEKGSVLPRATARCTTPGRLNEVRDNVVVVCPTWSTATPSDTAG